MQYWETADSLPDLSAVSLDYAKLWQAADKIVYSTTIETVGTARTRIERSFDPDAIRALKATADRDITVGGPDLAAHALRAGLVDEINLYVGPVVVGGGKPALPSDLFLSLELLDERRFGNGVVYLRYRTTT
jgi:dihydrofolate reductase